MQRNRPATILVASGSIEAIGIMPAARHPLVLRVFSKPTSCSPPMPVRQSGKVNPSPSVACMAHPWPGWTLQFWWLQLASCETLWARHGIGAHFERWSVGVVKVVARKNKKWNGRNSSN
jgi:hypothetical protein